MKNKKMKVLFSVGAFLCALIAVIVFYGSVDAHSVINHVNDNMVNYSVVAMGVGVRPLYYSRNDGSPVYSNSSIQAAASGTAQPNVTCICDQQLPYRVPEFITLTATSTGIGSAAKITSFDDSVEAVGGTLGTIFFGIQEIRFGAGTIARQDGTLIFGADVIREILATRMLVIDYAKMTGTDLVALQSRDLNYIRGYISGNDTKQVTFQLEPNLNAGVVVMDFFPQDALGGNLFWKSNEAFQYIFVTAAGTIQIKFHVVGWNYYGN